MNDQHGRNINYMRVSITDRCNLRCGYCMPEPKQDIPHPDILRYEEILRICAAAVKLGVTNFKVTGGEPLVRKGAVDFIRSLKNLPGVRKVTLTTNGILLSDYLKELKNIGIDGINISIDAIDSLLFNQITGGGDVSVVLDAVKNAANLNIPVKINTVLLSENAGEWLKIAAIAGIIPVDVRYIELMPIGCAYGKSGPNASDVLEKISRQYGTLQPYMDKRGNGPASYYDCAALRGKIGIISANSSKFCANCNRVRLTADGTLKTCLCYDDGICLKAPLRSDATDEKLSSIISDAIKAKHAEHCFEKPENIAELKTMNRIGG